MISESPIGEWLDNPIFVKNVRARLRPLALFAGVLVILVICGSIIAIGYETNGFRSGFTYLSLLILQAILLCILGAAQIATTVGAARSSGILDFHRISPLSSAQLSFGFLLGAPIREYLLFATTLPFLLPCALAGVPTTRGIVQLTILLVATSWVLHSAALLGVLMAKRATATRGAGAVIVLLAVLTIPAILGMGQFVRRLNVDHELMIFGRPIPWLGVVLLDEAALLFFFLIACVRRMRAERAHPFSKSQAIACLIAVSLLAFGEMWDQVDGKLASLILLYLLVIVSIVMTAAVTPDRTGYMKGLLRVRKQRQARIRWWDDLAWNRVCLAILCAVVLITSSVAWNCAPAVTDPFAGPDQFSIRFTFSSMPLAIANGVLVVAYFGLALQYFLLTFRKHGMSIAGLFLFVIWGLPVIAGVFWTSGANPGSEQIGRILFAMSPILGIAFASAPIPDPHLAQIQFAAICPTMLFVFVFGWLAVSARRRIDREVRSAFDREANFDMAADRFLQI